RHDRRALDRVRVIVRPEGKAQGRARPLVGWGRGAVPEPGLALGEAVPDVVALERLGRLVGSEQAHPLGGIPVALVAAVIPIGHVVFLPSNPPSMKLAARSRRLDLVSG